MKEDVDQALLGEWNGKNLPHSGEWKYIVE